MATPSVASLSKQLSSLTKTASTAAAAAKTQGKDTTGITNAINKSNAMVSQTNRQGSKSFSGSTEEAKYNANVITPASLIKPSAVDVPVKPTPAYVAPVTAVSSPSLEALGTTVQNGQYVYDPTKSEAYNATAESNQKQAGQLQTYLDSLKAIQPASQEADYLKREKAAGIQKLQQQVNDYTSQINTIQKTSDAEALALEGQGRGITESIIGGQQAQIRREAAIQALPVQAQLDAAQGNLTAATQRLDKLWSIHQADLTQQYNFKKSVYDAVYNFASTSEKSLLDARINDIKTADAKAQANLSLAQEWSKLAVQTGQSELISQFTALDPKSPTFAADFGKLQAKVVDPNVALDTQIKRAQLNNLTAPKAAKRDTQVVDGKLIDMQTGEVITNINGGNLPAKKQEELTSKVNANAELKSLLSEYKGMLDTVGYEGALLGSENLGKYDGLRAKITTSVKKAEALGTLDNGVLAIINQMIGETPQKSWFNRNLFGLKSSRASASLGKQIEIIDKSLKADTSALAGYDVSLLPPEQSAAIDVFLGVPTTTQSSTVANYFK